MFSKETYALRRGALKSAIGNGLVVILGNNPSPANYTANTYTHRQDSSFLYFFGQLREELVGVIDIDNDTEWLFGDDISVEDIVWYGATTTVAEMAEQVDVTHWGTLTEAASVVSEAQQKGRRVHFLPPYRDEHRLILAKWLGVNEAETPAMASRELIDAVVSLRSTKTPEEIKEIERACSIGRKMHLTAMKLAQAGVTERFIGGMIDGIARAFGAGVSFASIVTMHGEVMHGNPSDCPLEAGRLLLCDAGAETVNHYCSDHTRTTPISGKFTNRQREIYTLVEECHDLALSMAAPEVKYLDVHLAVCRHIIEGMKALGLMKGDTDEALAAGAHALFLPHGLGHMMGMDVHDMEGLGQQYVGYDDEVRPSTQFGLASLRMGRRLQEGFVVTDEPGIYFIPALIDQWQREGTNAEFLNFDAISKYRDFGGIRIEDDVLITNDGARLLGHDIIPYHLEDVEDFLAQNRY